ncbi:MAG: hypothetical protein Q9209_007473 [Squamulea sp. 1 TL-2023]
MRMSLPFAIVAGVGPGTGATVAKKFGTAYPVALLARNPANYEDAVKEIKAAGGKAIGISADVTDPESVKAAITQTQEEFGNKCAAAVFNVGGSFVRKPFLELELQEFESGWEANGRGAFLFSQSVLPLLLNSVRNQTHPPTLIFTGATAAMRGSAQLAPFSTGKFALRSLAQSLAREFGPKGVHVAHVNVDGVIDIPLTKEWMKNAGEHAKIKPEAVSVSLLFGTLTCISGLSAD